MFPLKDDNPTGRTAVVTIALIAINCLVHFYQMSLPLRAEQVFVFQYGLIPTEIMHFADLTPEAPFPVWLSPFTSMFMHGDLWHLGGNMLYLWIFGNNVEEYLGPVRFLIFYIMSGLAAVLLFVAFDPAGTVPLVGASGAIAGILGAYLVVWPRARILTLIWIIFFIRLIWLPAIIILGYWFILQIIMAFSSLGMGKGGGVAWFAHVGGFLFGWIFMKIRHWRRLARQRAEGYDGNIYDR